MKHYMKNIIGMAVASLLLTGCWSARLAAASNSTMDDKETETVVWEEEVPVEVEATEDEVPETARGRTVRDGDSIAMALCTLTVGDGEKVFCIADIADSAHIYGECNNRDNTWVVISKREFRAYVYEQVAERTVLRASFPICYGRNAADKTRSGDACTPESRDEMTPFTICQIQDASAWRHTFADDPRGNMLAYGPYFMRLDLAGSQVANDRTIGIHGCGGTEGISNSYSVPGMDSEGCVRLRDEDLRLLRERYCEVGTKVYIKSIGTPKYDYEKAAEEALGDRYRPALWGNPLSGSVIHRER